MKFVIVGYGRVGSRTARILHEEGHEVHIIELDHEKAARAESEGFHVVQEDGTQEEVYASIDLDTVDALGALTGDLNANFAACMIASQHGCRTVLRIDEDYREEIYKKYADDVDEVVYPERLGAAGAKTALLGGDFNVIGDLTEQLQLSVFRIPAGSPAVGQRVSELELPESTTIYAHGRQDEPLTIPLPGIELGVGDRVAVIFETERLGDVRSALVAA